MKKFDNSFRMGKYILPVLLDSPDYFQREVVANLFRYLDDFMNTLMLELSRIEESLTKLSSMENRRIAAFEERFVLVTLWADYYFLLNTVDRAYQTAIQMYEKLGKPEKADQIKQDRTYLITHRMRNQIEHLPEKVPKAESDFYNQHRSMGPDCEIKIGELSFRVHESSLLPLYQIYDDISNIIEQKYVIPNKEIVDRLGLK